MLESTAVYMKDKILSLHAELTEARAQIAAKDVALRKPMKIEVCKGQAGLALYVNDRRVAGVRDNGSMTVILSALAAPARETK